MWQVLLRVTLIVLANATAIAVNAATSVESPWIGGLETVRRHPWWWSAALTVATIVFFLLYRPAGREGGDAEPPASSDAAPPGLGGGPAVLRRRRIPASIGSGCRRNLASARG
jgi:hypothetical protein